MSGRHRDPTHGDDHCGPYIDFTHSNTRTLI